jgi:hypothetical protein
MSGEAAFLPEFLPSPDAVSGFIREWVADLTRQHDDLAPVVSVVGEHVGKRGGTGGPGRGCPTATRKFGDAFFAAALESLRKHFQTPRRAPNGALRMPA